MWGLNKFIPLNKIVKGRRKILDKVVSYCKERLENEGFRITPQRMTIFCCLVESKDHPSAEMVYQKVKKEFPNISFDTVNRTLLSLWEKGLIRIVEGGSGPRRFDANLKKHYHFRCSNCKRIMDFDCPEYDNLKIPEDIANSCQVFRQEIILEGLCPDCLQKEEVVHKSLSKR